VVAVVAMVGAVCGLMSLNCFMQNHDYVIISGARRKEQRWDPHQNEQIVPEGLHYAILT